MSDPSPIAKLPGLLARGLVIRVACSEGNTSLHLPGLEVDVPLFVENHIECKA